MAPKYNAAQTILNAARTTLLADQLLRQQLRFDQAGSDLWVGEQLAAGQINQQQAGLLLDMQTTASRSVLLCLQGLSLLMAEEAINAALSVVKTAVNTALKFPLIA